MRGSYGCPNSCRMSRGVEGSRANNPLDSLGFASSAAHSVEHEIRLDATNQLPHHWPAAKNEPGRSRVCLDRYRDCPPMRNVVSSPMTPLSTLTTLSRLTVFSCEETIYADELLVIRARTDRVFAVLLVLRSGSRS